MKTSTSTDAGKFLAVRVELELTITATPARVWKALTEELDDWWAYKSDPSHSMVLELRAGGRFFEKYTDGSELLWYQLDFFQPEKHMTFWGHMSPPWSLPVHNTLQFFLKPADNGAACEFRLVEYVQGLVEAKVVADLEGGWKQLVGEYLKDWVESGKRPAGLPK
jgi:uncharacterized protein YndB with AHSA1/START domain